MYNTQGPQARQHGLIVQELQDEILVYDIESNKAKCLNETSAAVWKACDGKRSVSDIAVSLEMAADGHVSEELVLLAIDLLQKNDLLEEGYQLSLPGHSRRDIVRKLGFATVMALPVVASLAVPSKAIAAASCVCIVPTDCISQVSCPSITNCAPATGTCIP